MNQNKVLTYINSNEILKAMFKEYLDYCHTISLPYHNILHTFHMMEHIITLYENQDKYTDVNLKTTDLLILLLAALFHDINHSGGICSDYVNVENARVLYNELLYSVFVKHKWEGDFDESIYTMLDTQVSYAIIATEYPYTEDYNDLQQNEKIIRELDFISQLSDTFFTHTLCGLKEELRSKSWVDAVTNYTTFTENMIKELRLEYSKEYVKNNINNILNILTNISAILK